MTEKRYDGIPESSLRRHVEKMREAHPDVMATMPAWEEIDEPARERIAKEVNRYNREMHDFGMAISRGEINTGLRSTQDYIGGKK